MTLPRIRSVTALPGFRLHLLLTDGVSIERDVAPFLRGPLFQKIRDDAALFAQVRVEGGGVAWPNGADICPDVLIWGGMPPAEPMTIPACQQTVASL